MVQHFAKGLNRDTDPVHQPEGTYQYAQNMVFNRLYGSLSSEKGFEVSFYLQQNEVEEDHVILGGIPLIDGKLAVFTKDLSPNETSRIFLIYPDDHTEILIDESRTPAELNFNYNFQVVGENKENFQGEHVIFFTDDFNPPRRINISTVQQKSPADVKQSDVNLFPRYDVPELSSVSVDPGGNVETGAYSFFFQYEDENGNRSDVVTIAGCVPVASPRKGESYRQFHGTPPRENSSKKITFSVDHLDTSYSYLRVGAISEKDGVKDAFLFREYAISGNTLNGVFTGAETREEVPFEKLYRERSDFQQIKSLTTLNNQLWAGNVKYKNNIDYQPYANNITVDYEYSSVDKTEVKPGQYDDFDAAMTQSESYKNANKVCFEKTFMPGEVYAFYIAPVFDSGKEGFAYHIPGRQPEAMPGDLSDYQENSKVEDIDVSDMPSSVVSHLDEDLEISNEIRLFHTHNTHDNWKAPTGMGFWENQDERYPDTENFKVKDVDNNQVGDLRGQKVRHHKMPDYEPSYANQVSNKNYLYHQNDDKVRTLYLKFDNITVPEHIAPVIQGFRFYFAKRDGENYTVSAQSLIMPHGFNYRPDQMPENTDEDDLPKLKGHPVPYNVDMSDDHPDQTMTYDPDTADPDEKDRICVGEVDDRQNLRVRTHPFDIMADDTNRPKVDFVKTQQIWYSKLFDFSDTGDGLEDMVEWAEVQKQGNTGKTWQQTIGDGCLVHHNLTQPFDYGTLADHFYWGDGPTIVAAAETSSERFYANNQVYENVDNTGSESAYSFTLKSKNRFNRFFGKDARATNMGPGQSFNHKRENGYHAPISDRFQFGWGDYKDDDGNVQYDKERDNISVNGNGYYWYTAFNLINLQRFRANMYIRFDDQQLVSFNNTIYINGKGTYTQQVVKGGDAHLSDYSYRNTAQFMLNYKHKSSSEGAAIKNARPLKDVGKDLDDLIDSRFAEMKVLYTYFCLTTSNANLRDTDNGNHGFYPELDGGDMDKKDFIKQPIWVDNSFYYNKDYNCINDNTNTEPFPLNETFNDNAPTVVAGSEPDTWEKDYDPWQNFFAQNYRDFGRSHGEIWKIKGYDDKMFIHFENALFQTMGRSQMKTSGDNVYIGGQGVLQAKPKQMLANDHAMAGLHSQHAAILTKYGYFFPDIDYGKVYLVSDGIKEISRQGLNNFFEQNLRPSYIDKILKRYRDSGVNPPDNIYKTYDRPHDEQPVGLTAEFDEYNERILLTKHDIDPGDALDQVYLLAPDEYSKYYNYFTNMWIVILDDPIANSKGAGYYLLEGELVELEPYGPDTFSIRKLPIGEYDYFTLTAMSWTVSYYPQAEQWVSYHDYTPSVYLRRKNELFSANNIRDRDLLTKGRIFRHNITGSDHYYNKNIDDPSGDPGTPKVEFADLVLSPEGYQTSFLHSIVLITQLLDNNGNEQFGGTFTDVVIYNNYQCSGIVSLDSARLIEGKWQFNNFSDLVTDPNTAILHSDRSVNQNNIRSNKPWFTRGDFRNNYHIVRVINNRSHRSQYAEIFLHALDANQRISQR